MIRKGSYIILIFISLLVFSCKKTIIDEISNVIPIFDTVNTSDSDTLRVGTIYGSTSYFYFRDEVMGYDYKMACHLADFLKLKIKLIEANSESELIKMLNDGDIDIAAYNFIITKELKSNYSFVFPQPETQIMLVQNIGIRTITDATELKGKTVYVKPNTVFEQRLKNLNKEIGGEINIKYAEDSINSDELLEMVASKKAEFTVTNNRTASLYKSQFKRLDTRIPLTFNLKNGWLINKKDTALKKDIEIWLSKPDTKRYESNLYVEYWEKSPYFAARKIRIPKGAISPYDVYFKKYALEIQWDWQLLAAVAFHESRFDSEQVSWAGAAGIMQLMPHTGANFGLNRYTVFDPEKNIEAGAQYIKSLNMTFRKITDKEERIKFILASYNSGPAHIFDAMALAQKYGKNPHIWFDNVDLFLLKKNQPQFYKDPVVKFGRFHGRVTCAYVINTLETYNKYLNKY